MKTFIAFLIFAPNLLMGQSWKIQDDNPKGKYRFVYWLTITEKPDNSEIFEPIVYQINSKSELTDEEKMDIEFCLTNNPQDFYKKCSKRNRYKVIMHI